MSPTVAELIAIFRARPGNRAAARNCAAVVADELERVERELEAARAARAADEDLLRRVFGALHVGRRHTLLWTIVMDIFGLGSTSAQELCVRLGYDPDQRVSSRYPAQRKEST